MIHMALLFQKFLKRSEGSVLVELTLVISVLFFIFAGLINFGYVAIGYLKMNVAMNAGVLYAFTDSSSTTNIQNAMTNAVSQSSLTTSISQFCECSNGVQPGCSSTCSDGRKPGSYMTIDAQLSLTLPFTNFILTSPYTISEKVTFRTQ